MKNSKDPDIRDILSCPYHVADPNKPVLVIDCYGLGFTVAHALPDLAHDENPTSVIFGFLRQMLSLAKEHGTNQFLFCWDSKCSKRKELCSTYKNKDKDPAAQAIRDVAMPQLKLLRREILPGIGFNNNFIQKGYEADDLVAAIVLNNRIQDKPLDLILVSGDEDFYQLFGPHCRIWQPRKKMMRSLEWFVDKWGIPPGQWVTVKALAGCSSDNVIGVDGVGEWTAAAIITGKLKKGIRYTRATNAESAEIEIRNRPLVELPFPGTRRCRIRLDDLSTKAFLKICMAHGINVSNSHFQQWRGIILNNKRKGDQK